MDRTELISLLDVPSEPTTGQVRQARRTLARRLHPDAVGQESAPAMAEINAAVDAWIAEIRSLRQADATVPAGASPDPTPTDAHVPFRIRHAMATVLLVGVVMAVVVVMVGPSVSSLAAGALLGAVAGAVYAAVLYRTERG